MLLAYIKKVAATQLKGQNPIVVLRGPVVTDG
jgi:hypothetical protein